MVLTCNYNGDCFTADVRPASLNFTEFSGFFAKPRVREREGKRTQRNRVNCINTFFPNGITAYSTRCFNN